MSHGAVMSAIEQLVLILAAPAIIAFALAAYQFTADVYRGGTKWEDKH